MDLKKDSVEELAEDIRTLHSTNLRSVLVAIALEWELRYGVAPTITSAVSEYDAAILVGQNPDAIGKQNIGRTAVTKGTDFIYKNIRYQVKANRPSGKPGSFVTLVAKASNYEWDRLIWILYNREFNMMEAWEWKVDEYRALFDTIGRLSPADMRKGKCLFRSPGFGPHTTE